MRQIHPVVAVACMLVIQLVAMALSIRVRDKTRAEAFFISRKSSLYDAGVTLDSPQVRALGTAGR